MDWNAVGAIAAIVAPLGAGIVALIRKIDQNGQALQAHTAVEEQITDEIRADIKSLKLTVANIEHAHHGVAHQLAWLRGALGVQHTED